MRGVKGVKTNEGRENIGGEGVRGVKGVKTNEGRENIGVKE